MSETPLFEARFLQIGAAPHGRRFAIHHLPRRAPVGCVVYVHPFAEEMNKSRRMAALQSRALAREGYAVLQLDLLGCGDSEGEFSQATWQAWVDDVVAGVRWLQERHPGVRGATWLWGLRAGCLLAVEAARRLDGPGRLLLWQPPSSGKMLLQQFLRLKAASELMAGQAKAVMDQLRAEISAGQPVDIAGYTLAADLCRGLEQAALSPPGNAGQLIWLETNAAEPPSFGPASQNTLQTWRAAHWAIDARCVHGAAFWQTAEIEDVPALIEATTDALTAAKRPRSSIGVELTR